MARIARAASRYLQRATRAPTCTWPPASSRASACTATLEPVDGWPRPRRRRAARAPARDRHRRAVGGVRGERRPRLRLRPRRRGPLPRQLPAPGERRRRGVPHHSRADRPARGAQPAAGDREARRPAAGASCWSPARPARASRRRSPRSSTRSTAPTRKHIVTIEDPVEFVHQNKKSVFSQREVGARHRELRRRAARRDPPGRRRHPGRRDARPRDDLARDHRRRDGHAGLRHAAHQRRGQDDRPHHRRLPGRRAGAGPRPRLAESLAAVVSQLLLPTADGKGPAAPSTRSCSRPRACRTSSARATRR